MFSLASRFESLACLEDCSLPLLCFEFVDADGFRLQLPSSFIEILGTDDVATPMLSSITLQANITFHGVLSKVIMTIASSGGYKALEVLDLSACELKHEGERLAIQT
jgi:hypothetical protein